MSSYTTHTIKYNEEHSFNTLKREGQIKNDVALVFFHGLDGNPKLSQPLEKGTKDYDLFVIFQRGHEGSLQKTSTSVKKHIQDVGMIVESLYREYKYVFLIGESMGGLYTSKFAFKNKVDGVFAFGMPFNPKNISLEKPLKNFYVNLRVILTFFTSINYKYKTKINYHQLTNSPFLLKLNDLQNDSIRQTTEPVALWKASLVIKHWFKRKKSLSPIIYWQGMKDHMSNSKLITKFKKNKDSNIEFLTIEDGMHILLFDKNFPLILEKINSTVENVIKKSK